MEWSEADIRRLKACQNDKERSKAFPDTARDELRRVARMNPSVSREEVLGKVADLFERSGIDPDHIARAEKFRLNEWDGFIKNKDDEIEKTRMSAVSVVVTADWEDGPQWPVIQQAAPVHLPPVKVIRPERTFKTAVYLSDPHVGFLRFDDELMPMHDERAMDVTIQLIKELQPDLIINGGDSLDLAEWSMKFATGPEAMFVTQPAIDRFYRFLCEQKLAAPGAEIRLMEGNHDRRMMNFVSANAKASLRLKQADQPKGWPVLSVPFLLRLDELGVQYVDGYPACWTPINENLIAIHGHKTRSSGNTAQAIIDDERISVLFGHIHRHESAMKTRRTIHKESMSRRTNLTQSFGCLCHIDGRVPSVRGATDLMGRPIPTAENWQQGIGVISYVEGDGPFDVERVYIQEGMTIFRGNVIASSS